MKARVLLLTVATLAISALAWAETYTCENEFGSCEIDENGGSCTCAGA